MLLYRWWFSSEIQIKLIDPLVSVIKDKNLESEDADEDMWVPSDLESESEPGEDGEEKMDEGDWWRILFRRWRIMTTKYLQDLVCTLVFPPSNWELSTWPTNNFQRVVVC